ncbi:MAG: hydrogenase iron-sulfur subunit [Acidobacteria bacterium]|nr:hydrogenase iron-sulfur subunit [Acidobacteriota bacterium]
MDKKLGVYICSGCGIGDAIDTEKLARVAARECKAPLCKVHPFLCGEEGIAAVRMDVADGAVNTLIVAACSPRAKSEVFSFDPGATILERVNLREHVSWSHKAKDEDTQMLAEDYLRMGVVKARKSEPLEPVSEAVSKKLLVVGGGITGISAALAAADAGYEVALVEKEAKLGGFVATLKQRFPALAPYTEPAGDGFQAKIDAASYHSKIQVFKSARILRTAGQPGMFDVTIETPEATSEIRAGAIVLATGWKPYDASRLGHLGYGASPDVVTNVEFERLAAAGKIVRPSDGKPAGSVLFVQCAGSRDQEHLSYCSSVCCMATLKHATYIREQNPDAQVFIVYKDMRTPGLYERFYRAAQDHPLNFLTKGEVTSVAVTAEGKLAVQVRETLIGEAIQMRVDLVVLATGMAPASADGEAIRALEDAEIRCVKSESEGQRAEAARTVEQLKIHKGSEILNLTYRQGPDLPVLKYGFPDSHFVCFPYETRRTGIYAAGAVRAPMDAQRAEEDAWGAALKAIQSVELAERGQAVHPRAGDTSFPSFFLQRCTQCKRCTEECPFGTLDEDEKGTPKPNPYRCRRCGICMGSCPERIVSFKNYSVDMIASMIKAIEVPEEDEEKPRVLVFMCENDAYPALDLAGYNRLQYDPSVRVIPLRCLGSLNIVWIADALSRGIDGVMLIGCKYGDDYQCHFVRGSELANRRLENVKETLQRLQLETGRLQLTELAIHEYGKLPELIGGFMERIREMGPNPYKGF